MVALVALLVWRLHFAVVLPVFLVFIALDGAYITSVLTKIPEGAWFTFLLAGVLSSTFILWRFGKEAQWAAESLDKLPPEAIFTNTPTADTTASSRAASLPANLALTPALGGTAISTVPGFGIFFDKRGDPALLPASFAHFVRKFAARPSVLVFLHTRALPLPSIPCAERYVVSRVARLPHAYAVVLRHGYADDVLRPALAREIVAQIELVVGASAAAAARDPGTPTPLAPSPEVQASLSALSRACAAQTVYVLGKEVMRIKRAERRSAWAYARRVLLGAFLWIRDNSRAKLADLDIDVDKLIEVGFVNEI